MKASLLRQRASTRAVVLTLVVAGAICASAVPAFASGPASLGVTGWQVYATNTQVTNPSSNTTVHGNPAEFVGAPAIPAQGDSGWVDCGPNAPVRLGRNMCPSSTNIGMAVSSILPTCWNKLNFTWFQALVSIPDGTSVSQFSVDMSGADDGAQISLVNSAYPNGVTPTSGYIYQGTQQATGDLSAYVVPGEVNRVIITQVDDCPGGNNLNSAQIFLNGTVIPSAPSDTTAPTDSPSFPSGWSSSDATVNWNWSDSGSGIDPSNCTQSSTSAGEGAVVVSASCSDLAGNTASDSVTVHVDKTAPVASPTVPPGWSTSDQTVDWNWSDSGSGIDPSNCTQSSTSAGEGAVVVSASCSDLAGNTASDSVTVHVDKTAPAAAPVASATGWSNSDVTVSWNWSDGGSGIDPSNCTQSTTSSGEGTITLSATCADLAGNTASQSATVQVDKTAPTIVYSGPTSYTVDQTVAIACSASDTLSGVASSSCAGASGAAWSFGLGAHSLSASATDNAGNTGSGSVTFTVTVDAASLCNVAGAWAKNQGIANSLCTKLRAADAAAARGQAKTKQNDIDAFDHEVAAQSGKGFTASQAALLVQFAAAL